MVPWFCECVRSATPDAAALLALDRAATVCTATQCFASHDDAGWAMTAPPSAVDAGLFAATAFVLLVALLHGRPREGTAK